MYDKEYAEQWATYANPKGHPENKIEYQISPFWT